MENQISQLSELENICHLLHTNEACCRNSAVLSAVSCLLSNKSVLITGKNDSGKSTFIRDVLLSITNDKRVAIFDMYANPIWRESPNPRIKYIIKSWKSPLELVKLAGATGCNIIALCNYSRNSMDMEALNCSGWPVIVELSGEFELPDEWSRTAAIIETCRDKDRKFYTEIRHLPVLECQN